MRNFEEWDGAVLADLDPERARRVIFYDECGSTNDEARRLAKSGCPDGTVVLAEKQSAGRGRRGQVWHCPPGGGIAVTVVLRPDFPRGEWSRLALAGGLAVAGALEEFGVAAEVKWPNDVWVDWKKICGVLVEAEDDFVLLGIGLNVNVAEFPADLAQPATSLFLEKGEGVGREEMLLVILRHLERRVTQAGRDFSSLLADLGAHCALRGKEIELTKNGEKRRGIMAGFGSEGELLLQLGDGKTCSVLQAEGIRVLG